MEFPRLTSGNLGALTFAHVNEIFRRIEELENTTQGGATNGKSTIGLTFLARITAVNEGRAAFVQVARNSASVGQFDEVQGGATSTQGDNQFAFPIYSSDLRANQIVSVCARRMTGGAVAYEAIVSEPPETPFIIVSHAGNPPVWTYSGREARWDGLQRRFYAVENSPIVTLFNGAENPIDNNEELGVGTKVLDATPFTRRPIKNDTVVVATKTRIGEYVFSVPNGYEVLCQ